VPCPEDGLCFDLSELVVEEIRGAEEYPGKCARFFAFPGTARIRVQMDFGFGDTVTGGPEEIEYPAIFSGLPAPRLRAYRSRSSLCSCA